MAQDSDKEDEKSHQEIEAKLSLAVRAIERDENLRFLLRVLLRNLGTLPQQSVFSPDPIQNAFDQGRQSAGLELVQIITAQVPMLWPALQMEEMTSEPA